MQNTHTIGGWTPQDLSRYLVQQATNDPPSIEVEVVTATKNLVVGDDITLSPAAVTRLKAYLGLP